MNIRIDPYTGETFIPKKISQRFATSENRIKFNNDKAKKNRIELAPILNPIKTNYRIIKELIGTKTEIEVNKHFLRGKGFNFEIITQMDMYDGRPYPLIFEYLIVSNSKNDNINIILWQ